MYHIFDFDPELTDKGYCKLIIFFKFVTIQREKISGIIIFRYRPIAYANHILYYAGSTQLMIMI